MLPSKEDASWPRDGEIDILEARGSRPNEVLQAVHFGDSWETRQCRSNTTFVTPNQSYGFRFHRDVEGNMTWRINDTDVFTCPPPSEAFKGDFHLIINLAVGGAFDNHALPPEDFKREAFRLGNLVVTTPE